MSGTPQGPIRCRWTVEAGLILGEPDGLYHREWTITAEEWAAGRLDFSARQSAAMTYVAELQLKAATGREPINWVRWSFVWI
jgi:hypothetical protein